MTSVRLTVSFFAALTLAGSLFWFLYVLINVKVDAESLRPAARIEFTRLRRDSDVQSRREIKPKLELPVAAPTQQMVATAGAAVGGGANVGPLDGVAGRVPGMGFSVGGGLGRINVRASAGSDRDVIPLVRIEPDYPMYASQRGIEGWVLIGFNITPIGTVKDAVVLDSDPKGVFDMAALRAVSRWKYNPKVEEGVAVERRGLQVVLRFNLEKNKQP